MSRNRMAVKAKLIHISTRNHMKRPRKSRFALARRKASKKLTVPVSGRSSPRLQSANGNDLLLGPGQPMWRDCGGGRTPARKNLRQEQPQGPPPPDAASERPPQGHERHGDGRPPAGHPLIIRGPVPACAPPPAPRRFAPP